MQRITFRQVAMAGSVSLRLAGRFSQGDFRPAETHRDPGGDKLQHQLAGATIIIRQVIGKLDAASNTWLPRHPYSIPTVVQTTFYIERIECDV
jgi:hypothetical protein